MQKEEEKNVQEWIDSTLAPRRRGSIWKREWFLIFKDDVDAFGLDLHVEVYFYDICKVKSKRVSLFSYS